jgi:hypothetical protein
MQSRLLAFQEACQGIRPGVGIGQGEEQNRSALGLPKVDRLTKLLPATFRDPSGTDGAGPNRGACLKARVVTGIRRGGVKDIHGRTIPLASVETVKKAMIAAQDAPGLGLEDIAPKADANGINGLLGFGAQNFPGVRVK